MLSSDKHGGWRCVERCPDRVMKVSQSKWERKPTAEYNGICVEECPLNHTMDIKSGTCIPCNDTCEKRRSTEYKEKLEVLDVVVCAGCKGGVVRSLKDARKFEGCKHVEGSLIINVLIGGKFLFYQLQVVVVSLIANVILQLAVY